MPPTWEECNDPYELLRRSRQHLKQERFRWLAAEYVEQILIDRFYSGDETRYLRLFLAWVRGQSEHPAVVMPEFHIFCPLGVDTRLSHAIEQVALNTEQSRWAYVACHASVVVIEQFPRSEGGVTTKHHPRSKKKLAKLEAEQRERLKHWRVAKVAHQKSIELAFCNCFRDVAGNPFHPVSFDPCWRSDTVMALARGIHAEAAFDRMPILADAMEEAGCAQPTILHHCRSQQHHVRGCWVISELFEDKWDTIRFA